MTGARIRLSCGLHVVHPFNRHSNADTSIAHDCRTDIPYAALSGEDSLPDRRHVFHVAGLPPGSRHNDISTAFALAGQMH